MNWKKRRKKRKQIKRRIIIQKNDNIIIPQELIKDSKIEYDEPFGLPKGTIRGFITMVITTTFCMMSAKGMIPIQYFLYVSMGVILSYFFTRLNLSNIFK